MMAVHGMDGGFNRYGWLFVPQVQTALQAEYLQEFYQTVRDKCFKACIPSPSSSLSSSEQKCLSRCMDRYREATELITKTVVSMQGGMQ